MTILAINFGGTQVKSALVSESLPLKKSADAVISRPLGPSC